MCVSFFSAHLPFSHLPNGRETTIYLFINWQGYPLLPDYKVTNLSIFFSNAHPKGTQGREGYWMRGKTKSLDVQFMRICGER